MEGHKGMLKLVETRDAVVQSEMGSEPGLDWTAPQVRFCSGSGS